MDSLATFTLAEPAVSLLVPATVLVLPTALALYFRHAAVSFAEVDRAAVWGRYRRLTSFLLAITVAMWWAIWDWGGRSDLIQKFVRPDSGDPSYADTWIFWFPPIASLGVFVVFCYAVDRSLLNLRWSSSDILRRAWWKLVSFVVPLLMVAVASNDFMNGNMAGIAWLAGAGLLGLIGTIGLRTADGMKLHTVKSGEFRNRALALARRMGMTLRAFYVIPAGKGHLTNACAGLHGIGLTDNLGKYLTRQQVDCVLAHELAHLKHRHASKKFLLTVSIFLAVGLILFLLRPSATYSRVAIDFAVILAPLLVLYFVSRRYEYAADREASSFIGDPQNTILALANLYRASAGPAECSLIAELFSTHPSLARRARAIGACGNIPAARVSEILQERLLHNSDALRPAK